MKPSSNDLYFLCFLYLQHDNVERVLSVLRQNSVPGIEHITTNDIVNGRLKAILSLFFSLSRYKQANKIKDPLKLNQNQKMLLRSQDR